MAARAFDTLVAALVAARRLREAGPLVALAGHTPALSERERRLADAYLAKLRASPYAPPVDGVPPANVFECLVSSGAVVRIGEVVFAGEAYREMVEGITDRLHERGAITLAEVRDMFGTSRRYAQALLEHLDAERVTKRVGDVRVLR
jgi:selenocysteine-specific elongation factor